jgi:hypothetical protein
LLYADPVASSGDRLPPARGFDRDRGGQPGARLCLRDPRPDAGYARETAGHGPTAGREIVLSVGCQEAVVLHAGIGRRGRHEIVLLRRQGSGWSVRRAAAHSGRRAGVPLPTVRVRDSGRAAGSRPDGPGRARSRRSHHRLAGPSRFDPGAAHGRDAVRPLRRDTAADRPHHFPLPLHLLAPLRARCS